MVRFCIDDRSMVLDHLAVPRIGPMLEQFVQLVRRVKADGQDVTLPDNIYEIEVMKGISLWQLLYGRPELPFEFDETVRETLRLVIDGITDRSMADWGDEIDIALEHGEAMAFAIAAKED